MSHPFFAIFRTEVLLNSKRVAPYFMALLCGGNALLWWGWGPALGRGLATNSDAFISGVLPIFSFLTLPLFTAVIMADPVIRDFRAGIDPLIFSNLWAAPHICWESFLAVSLCLSAGRRLS